MNVPAASPRYQALLQLLRTAESLWNASRIFFDRWDLSPSQFNVLNVLYLESDGISQSELSRRLIMHRSNVTGLTNRLEERKLVRRLELAGDRRAYRVVLTRAGRELLERIFPHYYRAAEGVWGRFPADRADRLLAELKQVSENADRVVSETVQHP